MIALAMPLTALAEPEAAGRHLVRKDAEKQEIRNSMIGFRDTLIFYTFNKQKAVLRLKIDNRQEKFPVTASVVLFNEDATEEGIGKWVNNQHSDALFVDAAEPVSEVELPAGSCQVIEKKVIDQAAKDHMGKAFHEYEVKVSVEAHEEKGKLKLDAFKDDAKVYLKVAEG